MQLQTHRDVIQAFGGPTPFAAALGLKVPTAQSMYERDSISPDYWERVSEAAKAKRLRGVTYAALGRMRTEKQRRSRASASAAQESQVP